MRRRFTEEERRKLILDTMKKHDGNREEAAEALEVSLSTINREIKSLNLWDDLENLGLIRNAGPPRNKPRGSSRVQKLIIQAIKEGNGHIDNGVLVRKLYGLDDQQHRDRLYSALDELKSRGVITKIEGRYFVL